MRGSWLVVALAASAVSGCSQWPRSANLGEDPEYADPDTVVTVPVTYDPEVDESDAFDDSDGTDGWPADPTLSALANAPAFGFAQLFRGTLTEGGWSDTSGLTGCGPVPGFYDGDSDGLLLLPIEVESYICARGRLDTTEAVGWDLSLINIASTGCAGPVRDPVTDLPVGGGITRPEAVWGVTVPPGDYALQIGAYHPGTVDLDVAYTVGISVWAPFTGSAKQCPLLEAAP